MRQRPNPTPLFDFREPDVISDLEPEAMPRVLEPRPEPDEWWVRTGRTMVRRVSTFWRDDGSWAAKAMIVPAFVIGVIIYAALTLSGMIGEEWGVPIAVFMAAILGYAVGLIAGSRM